MNQADISPFIGGYWSSTGKVRQENEDRFYVARKDLAPQTVQVKGYLGVVADGMGGHAKGEVASEIAARRVAEEYYADPNPDPQQALRRAVQVANAEIFSAAQRPDLGGMGTTLVAAVVVGNHVIFANVGDSRAYLISRDKAIQVTHDHSWVQERVDKGILTDEQARQHAQRNLITRALGSQPQVDVDLFTAEARPGDWVLLCSDGLSNTVHPEEMARMISQHTPRDAAEQLIGMADARGGPDNSTVVILPVGGGAAPIPQRAVMPWLLPLAAAFVGVLILALAFLAIRLQSASVAQTQTQTQTAIAMIATSRAATAAVPTVTLINPPTPTVAGVGTRTKETPALPSPTATVAITATQPTTTPVATNPAAAIISTTGPITSQIPAASPTSTVTTTVPMPPQGDLTYKIPRDGSVGALLKDFGFTNPVEHGKDDDIWTFYRAHPEIWCLQSGDNQDCIREGATLRLKQGNQFGEINRVGLGDSRLTLNNPVWLVLQVDEGTKGILNDLAPAVLDKLKGQWIFVHGYMTVSLHFKIEPPDFTFVWNIGNDVYEQVKLQ